jgi:hypothetical protein
MHLSHHYGESVVRLHESAAEEIGRLDALVSVAPPSVALTLRAAVVADLAAEVAADHRPAQATRALRASLVAAAVDVVHAAALDPALDAWATRVDDGERRARSGAPLALPDVPVPAAVHDALRPAGAPRPLLTRALHALAWAPDPATGDLLAGLVLVAGGQMDRLRMLLAPHVAGTERAAAAAAWRAGDAEPLARLVLPSAAAEARHLRLQLKLLLEAQRAEDEHLASIGRPAVTGRRVLALLRTTLATSVPDLSERLSLSRPAAGAALERLVALGLAEEITGRGRDRVFVYAGAWALA